MMKLILSIILLLYLFKFIFKYYKIYFLILNNFDISDMLVITNQWLLPLEQFFASKCISKTLSSFVSTAILPPIRVFLRETGKHVMHSPTSQSQKISRGRCNLYNVSNDTGMDQNLSKERPCDRLSLSHQYGKATMLMQQLVTKGATRPKPASQKRRERSRNQEPSKMWAKRPHCTRQWNKLCKLFQNKQDWPRCQNI